jgi:hypothetical protein
LTVSRETRETVDAVAALLADGASDDVSNKQVAAHLELDESATSRRASKARKAGYLVNREDRRGKPARYVVGEAMPADTPILPEPSELAKVCTVARLSEGRAPVPDAGSSVGPDEPPAIASLPVATDAEQERYERAVRLIEEERE